MISGLLNNLIGQYNLANAPNPAPATSDPNGLLGLLQTTGIPMTQTPIETRTPDYISLLGMLGMQPFTPGYTPVGGGEAIGTPTSDYLNSVLGGGSGTGTGTNPLGPTLQQLYQAGLMGRRPVGLFGNALGGGNVVDGYRYYAYDRPSMSSATGGPFAGGVFDPEWG